MRTVKIVNVLKDHSQRLGVTIVMPYSSTQRNGGVSNTTIRLEVFGLSGRYNESSSCYGEDAIIDLINSTIEQRIEPLITGG